MNVPAKMILIFDTSIMQISHVLRTTNQLTSSQQAIRSPAPAEFVRSAFDDEGQTDAFCPPVRSNFPHAKQANSCMGEEMVIYLSEGQLA